MKNRNGGFTVIELVIIVVILAIITGGISIWGSKENARGSMALERVVDGIFTGDHVLRKMVEKTESEGQISGSFFLFSGSFNGESKSQTYLSFAWLMNDGKTYQISRIPLNKVKVVFGNVEVPTIKFRISISPQIIGLKFQDKRYVESHIQEILDEALDDVLITCKEDDWELNVQLPLS